MSKTLFFLIFVLSFILVSCGESSANSKVVGSAGGPCYENQTCDEGLVCEYDVCACSESNKFCHEHDGLNWSDTSGYTNWDEANDYCENLGGRLPTISELRTLIQNCPGTETGGECGVADDCLSSDCRNDPCNGCEYDNFGKYSVFGDTKRLWSSSVRSNNTDRAYLVYFDSSYVSYYVRYRRWNARCVK